MTVSEFKAGAGLRYGGLGFALAFVALPLYVSLPAHYAAQYGVPLAALGALLLGARLFDALVDPWIGRFCDRLLNGAPPGRLIGSGAGDSATLNCGFGCGVAGGNVAGAGCSVVTLGIVARLRCRERTDLNS